MWVVDTPAATANTAIAGQKRCCMAMARPLRQAHHEYSNNTLLRCENPWTSTRSWWTWSCPGA